MKYKHILFDIDGTLVDNEKAVLSTWQQTIKELFNRYIEKDKLNFVLGIPGVTIMEKLGAENPEEGFKIWQRHFQEHRNEITLFKGIKEVVCKLKEKNLCLGLITSRTREELNNDDALCQIYHLFDVAICVTDTINPKPSADPILAYLQRTGATSSDSLYVGDSAYDNLCATNAQVDFALATWGNNKKNIPCKYKLKEPSDILTIL